MEVVRVGARSRRIGNAVSDLNLLVAFGAGVISFISPCVLPLLPGYLSLMSGYSVADLAAGRASSRRMLTVTALFVLGFMAVFVAAGALASGIGQFLARNQNLTATVAGWIVLAFGILMVLIALRPGLLSFLSRDRRLDVRPQRLGVWAPPVMGVAFGFAWTPCLGPVLGAILALASAQENVGQGVVLLTTYGLGLGIPFVLAGVGMARAFRTLSFLGRFLRPINVGSGLLLAAFGVLMITGGFNTVRSLVADFFYNTPFLSDLEF